MEPQIYHSGKKKHPPSHKYIFFLQICDLVLHLKTIIYDLKIMGQVKKLNKKIFYKS